MESWANDKAAGTNFWATFFLWAFYYPYLNNIYDAFSL